MLGAGSFRPVVSAPSRFGKNFYGRSRQVRGLSHDLSALLPVAEAASFGGNAMK